MRLPEDKRNTDGEFLIKEASRQLTICNACRYCEGYCDVWEAIERRRNFSKQDVLHLSNLCHDCRDCYYACPFIPPNELMINIPKVLGDVRSVSYEEFIRPRFLRKVMRNSGQAYLLLTVLIFLGSMGYVLFAHGWSAFAGTAIPMQELFPYPVFVALEYSLYLYVFTLWFIQGRLYWKHVSGKAKINLNVLSGALKDAFLHKNFKGGGAGCGYPSDDGNLIRLYAHASVMVGFIIDWISILFYPFTNSAILYTYFSGSVLITLGSSILILMLVKADMEPGSSSSSPAFTVVLFLTGVSGIIFILLLAYPEWVVFFLLRDSLIAAVFLLAPFSKFLHPVYRFLSLAVERYEYAAQRSEGKLH